MKRIALLDRLELPPAELSDRAFSCFFREASLPESFSHSLKEDESLALTLVDFSSRSYDAHLSFFLARNSRLVLKMASLCPQGAQKKIMIDVHHDGKDSFSRVSFVGIDFSERKFSFVGNSFIPKGMSGSDTRQEGRITNLSEECKSEVSPALFIEENDVKASHGAALGTYDQEQVYYLMAHGLSEKQSKRLITAGLLLPIVEELGESAIVGKAKSALEEFSL